MAGRLWALGAAAVCLSGCANPWGTHDPLPGSPAAAGNPRFATELVGPATYLAPMPTAVVVLTPDDLNRNRAFCNVLTAWVPTAQEARAASVVAPNLVLTRWLVRVPEVPAAQARDCDFLVGTYDYARAARLMVAARLSSGRFGGAGPFLVMVIPDAGGLHVVGLDGSGVAEAAFPDFVAGWGGALVRTERLVTATPDQPGLVRSLFDAVAAILRTALAIPASIIVGTFAAL